MRCYKCGSVLSETEYCNSCGADVAVYKKILKMSNTYYNMGLEKARVRDLSGAADVLRRSVRMNKRNIQARNLLGLVYYEMGEFVEALSQWVISKNIQPEKNVADDYIKDAQSNPTKLEAMGMTIKKYNTALGYAKEGSDDLAIIQLKKVVSLNPKYVKAYQLLALMYMKKEDYLKARKALRKSLLIDKNNTLSIKYLGEIDKATESEGAKKQEEDKDKKALSGNDVIIPEVGYKDVNYGLVQFITIVVGIIIGAAMVYFLVTPAKENNAITEYKETISEYSDKISSLNDTNKELQENLDAANAEKESIKAELEDKNNATVPNGTYDKLAEAAALYAAGDKNGCAVALIGLGDISAQSESFKKLYESLKTLTYTDAYRAYYTAAYQAETAANPKEAVDAFLVCLAIQPENLEILYHLGTNYTKLNNNVVDENAKKYFSKIIELAPESDFAKWSAEKIK